MSKERRRIISAATVILVVYALSRLLGYVRDVVIANSFGTGNRLDDYQVAFRVPDLLFNLLLAGAISSAFIPVLAEHLARNEPERARQIAQRVLNLAMLVLTLGAALLFALAPFFISVTVLGRDYTAADHELIVSLTRILLLQPIFLGAGGLVIGILTAHQRFYGQAPAPLVYNLAIIVAAVFFAPRFGVSALAWGVVIGAILHLGVQLPSLWRTGWRPRPDFDWHDPGVRKVARLMFPIALGLAAAQVNFFVDTFLATQLPHGRASALKYADTVAQVPLGTFSQALAFVLFPFLSRDAALNAIDSIRHRTALAIRLNIFTLVPASAGLAVLSVPIVALLFQRGQFTAESTRQTALALVFFTFGLTSQAATALLVRVFYALQDVRTPLRIAAVVVAVNLITNLVLVRTPLAQGGLALGTSIAATLNAVLLARVLHRRLGGIESGDIARSAGRALLAVLPMAALAFVLFQVLLSGSAGSDLRHLAIVLVIIPLAGLTYVAIQRILGSEELGVLLSAVRPGSKG